jgi:hypothetical protein
VACIGLTVQAFFVYTAICAVDAANRFGSIYGKEESYEDSIDDSGERLQRRRGDSGRFKDDCGA